MARAVISAGGIGTIVAVLGVFVFLVSVVLPLFLPARVNAPVSYNAGWMKAGIAHTLIDDYRTIGATVLTDGDVHLFRLDNGADLDSFQLLSSGKVSAVSFRSDNDSVVLGDDGGRLHLGRLGFAVNFVSNDDVEQDVAAALRSAGPGKAVTMGRGIVQLTPEHQFRQQLLKARIICSEKVSDSPVRLLRHVMGSNGGTVCFVTERQGQAVLSMLKVEEREDMMTGETSFKFGKPVQLPLPQDNLEAPSFLAVSGTGSDVFAGWRDGQVARIRCDKPGEAFIAERGRLTPKGVELRVMEFVLGDSTLVWGDAAGVVRGGFTVRLGEDFDESRRLIDSWSDGRSQFGLLVSKEYLKTGYPVTCLRSSARSRILFCGFENGDVYALNITSQAILSKTSAAGGSPVLNIALAPREDGFMALAPSTINYYEWNPGYPDASLASLFTPIWYEGYVKPSHMWQSSSASDDFEPKLGLVPLIFGTIKATLYAMLFGAPLALLAALFSSEFIHRRAKAFVKPLLEMMASLPSVVLGFLGALVFAPFVERRLCSVLLFVPSLLFCVLGTAHFWQILPARITRRLVHWRIAFAAIPIALGVALAAYMGPAVENRLFAGDIKNWLSWEPLSTYAHSSLEYRSSTGGWMLLVYPALIALIALFVSRKVSPLIRSRTAGASRSLVACIELVKFLLIAAAVTGAAWGIGALLDAAGMDPRSDWIFMSSDWSPLDTYVQRNALIVGVVMGFAVIPIIYTISDDALAAVPDHLRSASFGAGATTWQTATRIVLPTAMSGLFSALMIGMGRAVGETMIVLMALGNTPVMDWNIFNGARTLSANIAVELPEAVRNSAHYRTLFLAALVLFVMTFIVNTVAESVRLRFRKRAYQL
jgi:phosphate transport system permease protein